MSLPNRGTGLITGRAGARRYGTPRTEVERLERHLATNNPNNPGLTTRDWILVAGGLVGMASIILLLYELWLKSQP